MKIVSKIDIYESIKKALDDKSIKVEYVELTHDEIYELYLGYEENFEMREGGVDIATFDEFFEDVKELHELLLESKPYKIKIIEEA